MASKVVNLTIKLKDGFSNVLGKLRSGLKSSMGAFKNLAVAGIAATTAIVAALVKVAKVYAVQEKAEKDLAAAIAQTGETVGRVLPKYQKFAAEMQKVTRYGDEAVMSMMAYGINLGVSTDQIEDATKAAAGLAAMYKIDLQTAMMLVGRAALGQTQMLTRYGIILDETLSPQQKFNELLKIGARAFNLARAEVNTISCAWEQLKNTLGDAVETIGEALFGDGGLISGINQVRDAVAKMISDGTIEKWAEQAKAAFEAVVQTIKILTSGDSEARKEVISAIVDVIKAGFVDAGYMVVEILAKAAPFIGNAIGEAAKAAFKPKRGLQEGQRGAAIQAQREALERGATAEESEAIYQRAIRHFENMNNGLTREADLLVSALTVGAGRTQVALANLGNVVDAHSSKLKDATADAGKKVGRSIRSVGMAAQTASQTSSSQMDKAGDTLAEAITGIADRRKTHPMPRKPTMVLRFQAIQFWTLSTRSLLRAQVKETGNFNRLKT